MIVFHRHFLCHHSHFFTSVPTLFKVLIRNGTSDYALGVCRLGQFALYDIGNTCTVFKHLHPIWVASNKAVVRDW